MAIRANPQIITNPERTRFYCWGWDCYWRIQKLGKKCFKSGCRFMYVPALPHLRHLCRPGGTICTAR
jgi:hypothetical protein